MTDLAWQYPDWELHARESIRDTIARYTHNGDRGRIGELAGLFTEDGVLEVTGRATLVGRAAIEEYLTNATKRIDADGGSGADLGFVRHHVSNVLIQSLSPEEAEVVSYFLVLTKQGPDHWGRYRDRLVPDGDRWRFAHRTARRDASVEGSWGER